MASSLFNQTCYNLLESTLSPKKLVATAREKGYDSLAICDSQVLFAVPEFVNECQKQGLKAIIGLNINLEFEKATLGFCLYAKNDRAYQSLMRFSSLLNCNENVSIDDLIRVKDELFFCLLPQSSYIFPDLVDKNAERLTEKLNKLNDKLDYYLGLPLGNGALEKANNEFLRELASLIKIKTLALPLVKMADDSQLQLLRVMKAVKLQCDLKHPDLVVDRNCALLPANELKHYYSQQELANRDALAAQCQVTFNFPKATLPQYQNKEGSDSKTYLVKLCQKGLAKRLNNQTNPSYVQRLNYELDVITKMNYEDYFLLVYDFILFAKKQDIPIGPGRGSAAGSLVAFCLGITNVDPIKYNLVFERFLNAERISMPDIDTDIADKGRDEVVAYLLAKYDNKRSAHILTYGTFKAKQALRDVAKVYGLALPLIDELAKTIPGFNRGSLSEIYDNNPVFRAKINSSLLYQEIFTMAKSLEFFPRHLSTHAAGIVLCDKAIYNYVPLIMVGELLTTQFSMDYLEDFGLIKMDLLGLRNLTIIDDIVKAAGLREPNCWPLDDSRVYQLLSKADTLGIFQLEREEVGKYLRQMKPQEFEDIVAIVALNRPGPSQFIPQYIYNRQHPSAVEYVHADLEAILKPTYGILVYQEQIIQVVQKMAGFSLGKADILRKAISKKNEKELQAQKLDFIKGCLALGYSQDVAFQVFALIERFANYGFNRAHSVAYAMISYQTAYLKAVYPLFFFQALLNSVAAVESKRCEYIAEARSANIRILAPDINKSTDIFTIEEGNLRFPLAAIKGVGNVAVNSLLKNRQSGGVFKDFFDFVARCGAMNSANKLIEALIKVGAFDYCGINRQTLLASLERALMFGELGRGEYVQNSFDFGNLDRPSYHSVAADLPEDLKNEKELCGLYFSEHPSRALHQGQPGLLTINELKAKKSGKVAALITKTKPILTKNGAQMAFLTLEDEQMNLDVAVMPNEYSILKEKLQTGEVAIFDLQYSGKGFLLRDLLKGEKTCKES